MTAYILTAEAESDLRSVIRYTPAQWSAAQVRHYVSALERGMENIAEGKVPLKDLSALYPALRMARCQHHYISVCLETMPPSHRSDASRTTGSHEAFG